MEFIKKATLDAALKKRYRQYLTGNFECQPPCMQPIKDDIEIGISYYREFKADTPHMHPIAKEHVYVLSGKVCCRLLDKDGHMVEEHEFRRGDFFIVSPGQAHVTKNAAKTKVYFTKAPGINDKCEVLVDEDTLRWMKEPI